MKLGKEIKEVDKPWCWKDMKLSDYNIWIKRKVGHIYSWIIGGRGCLLQISFLNPVQTSFLILMRKEMKSKTQIKGTYDNTGMYIIHYQTSTVGVVSGLFKVKKYYFI